MADYPGDRRLHLLEIQRRKDSLPETVREQVFRWVVAHPYYKHGQTRQIARDLHRTWASVRTYLHRMEKSGQALGQHPDPGPISATYCPDCGEGRYPAKRNANTRCDRCAYSRGLQRTHERHARLRSYPSEKFSRDEVFERDGGRCWWCLRQMDPDSWELDHLIPVKTQTTEPGDHPGHVRVNVVVSCTTCNVRRGNRHDAWSDVQFLKGWYSLQSKMSHEGSFV